MPATPISAVWEHFQVFADKSSICKVDNCDLHFNPPLRSTTAKRHLRRKHPQVYEKVIEKEVERKAGQKEDEKGE
ncbi:hypothetical protein AAVH_22632 [Aphelenchoides avenae]|nr:hypothetical protein AAVH_22632 [Aphelenchus avenae]